MDTTPRTPEGHLESKFREEVRDILGLDVFTRDEEIYEKVRKLKERDILNQLRDIGDLGDKR